MSHLPPAGRRFVDPTNDDESDADHPERPAHPTSVGWSGPLRVDRQRPRVAVLASPSLFGVLALAALVVLPARLALAQDLPGYGLAQDDPLTALSILTDTSDAGLRVERARLRLARSELRAVTGWRRLRPAADFFVSMSTRGLAFPSISSQGYDPQYAAIARWPGDTWGVTLSWSIDQVLDRRPVDRARNAVEVAHARVDLYQARREQQQARDRERVIARAEREADERERDLEQRRRADLAAQQLRIEAGYLAQRVEAQQELTRLAQMKYDQGDLDYEGLARQRLALLSAEHAQATNAARLATLDAGGGVDVALRDVASPVETTAAPRPATEGRASSAHRPE